MKLLMNSRQNNVKGKTQNMLRQVKLKQCRLKKNMNNAATWGRGDIL